MEQILHIPDCYLTLLPSACRFSINSKQLAVTSQNSRLSRISSDPASISDYFAVKLLSLECEIQYLRIYRRALQELCREGKLAGPDFFAERNRLQKFEILRSAELLAITLERRVLAEDMAEELHKSVPIERAYAVAMEGRVNAATGKQRAGKLNYSKFKRDVLDYYDGKGIGEGRDGGDAWCHVLGWLPSNSVRAAHIVPKSLDEGSLAHLFGAKVEPAVDVRNTLLLCSHIETALDTGILVIVPTEEDSNEWQCIVIDEGRLNCHVSANVCWKDIHKRKLRFRNGNRPAKRYLYFRYLITYLTQKWKGNLSWVGEVETRNHVWASPRPYLRRSTLQTLAQQAFGEDLPEHLFDATLSDEDDQWESHSSRDRIESLALSLTAAVTEAAEAPGDGDEEDIMDGQ